MHSHSRMLQTRVRNIGVLLTSCTLMVFSSHSIAAASAQEELSQAGKLLGVDGLKSLEVSGSGYSFALGQAYTTTAPWPKFNLKSYLRVVSFEPWASRTQTVTTQFENPPRGGGRQPIVGERAETLVVAPTSPMAANLPDDLAVTLPQAFIKIAAAATDVSAAAQSKAGKHYTVISFTANNKAKTRGWINDQHLLERVETTIDNNVLGDIAYETTFADYKDFNGVKFPSHIVQKQAGYAVLDLMVSDAKPNVAGDFKPAGPGGPPPAGALASEKLDDGIYLITGGYASVAVEFKDHVTVIEAGQSDQRSAAVIAEVKRLFPGKPITEVVSTHPHFDHLGGVRAFVAEGATVITHASNKAYYQKVMTLPHTLAPDMLAKSPHKANIRAVNDKMTLTDGNQVIELYHQQDYGHHEGMLLAYLPKQKILIEADGYNPPAALATQTPNPVGPYTLNLVANIERLKLDVTRIIPIHLPADGRAVTIAELLTASGKN